MLCWGPRAAVVLLRRSELLRRVWAHIGCPSGPCSGPSELCVHPLDGRPVRAEGRAKDGQRGIAKEGAGGRALGPWAAEPLPWSPSPRSRPAEPEGSSRAGPREPGALTHAAQDAACGAGPRGVPTNAGTESTPVLGWPHWTPLSPHGPHVSASMSSPGAGWGHP